LSWKRAWSIAGSSPGVYGAHAHRAHASPPSHCCYVHVLTLSVCLVGSCRQVGICSGLVEARRGATGRRWHGEQQCGWDLSCHLTFTHLHPCLSRMLSLSPRTERSCPHAHVLAHAHAVAHAHPRPHLSHFIPRRSSSSSQPQPEVVRSLVCGRNFTLKREKSPPHFPLCGNFRLRRAISALGL
jgi:hypothetical protein